MPVLRVVKEVRGFRKSWRPGNGIVLAADALVGKSRLTATVESQFQGPELVEGR